MLGRFCLTKVDGATLGVSTAVGDGEGVDNDGSGRNATADAGNSMLPMLGARVVWRR